MKKQRTLMPTRQPRQTQLSTMASHGCSRPASAAKGCARDSSALSLWCALSTAHGTLCSRGRVAAAPWAQAARASPHAAAPSSAQPRRPTAARTARDSGAAAGATASCYSGGSQVRQKWATVAAFCPLPATSMARRPQNSPRTRVSPPSSAATTV